MWDVDGNRYIDLIGSWGPMIVGHAHPEVIDAITIRSKWNLFWCSYRTRSVFCRRTL